MSLQPLCLGGMVVLLIGLLAGTARAAEGPRPPCGDAPVPAYPAAIGAPVVQSQTVTAWRPPVCLGWDGAAPTQLIAIAGRLHETGGSTALLARLGAISRRRGIRYWSVTDQAWQPLITEAFAVTDSTGRTRRGDFQPDEMQPDVPLYSAERDSRSSGILIDRMRMIIRSPDRVVVSISNAAPVRAFILTLFAPGDLQTTYFLNRLGPDEWGFYGLWGITTGALTGGHAASLVNRAMAAYRHFAGIPTDQEPPAVRHQR